MRESKWLIGIDEVGRGPLAGPVAVGVFAITRESKSKIKVLKKVKDSKVLSKKERELIFAEIKKEQELGNCAFEVVQTPPLYIDTHGIVPAIKTAMKKALKNLEKKHGINPMDCEVLLDGSLKAPETYLKQKTIIKGDAKVPVISAASICAKVLRDRHMMKISKHYEHYNFHLHKGYGTKSHRESITMHGICKEHRVSFLKNLI